MPTTPVDLVVPTYNGLEHLRVCLAALRRQTYAAFRLIIVDDASADGTAAALPTLFPGAELLRLPRNVGLAAAVNAGIARGDAPYVALLNNDTEPEPGWLAALVAGLERHPEAAAAVGKLRLLDRRDVFHAAGDTYSRDGLPGNRGAWERDRGQYDREEEVFGACAGAALYRRGVLDEVAAIDGAVLDPGFFMYCEDVDLAWRIRLRGYGIVYVPDAIVHHRLSATGGGPLASYYVARNTLAVIVKDVPGPLLRRYLPRMVARQLAGAAATLPHLREPAARARLRGLIAFPSRFPRLLRQRRRIQSTRTVPPERIEQFLS